MIGTEDLRLNGINEPGTAHTWITGENWDALDHDITELHRTHNYREIAAELHVDRDLIKRRVRRLLKWGVIHPKNEWRIRRGLKPIGRPKKVGV